MARLIPSFVEEDSQKSTHVFYEQRSKKQLRNCRYVKPLLFSFLFVIIVVAVLLFVHGIERHDNETEVSTDVHSLVPTPGSVESAQPWEAFFNFDNDAHLRFRQVSTGILRADAQNATNVDPSVFLQIQKDRCVLILSKGVQENSTDSATASKFNVDALRYYEQVDHPLFMKEPGTSDLLFRFSLESIVPLCSLIPVVAIRQRESLPKNVRVIQ